MKIILIIAVFTAAAVVVNSYTNWHSQPASYKVQYGFQIPKTPVKVYKGRVQFGNGISLPTYHLNVNFGKFPSNSGSGMVSNGNVNFGKFPSNSGSGMVSNGNANFGQLPSNSGSGMVSNGSANFGQLPSNSGSGMVSNGSVNFGKSPSNSGSDMVTIVTTAKPPLDSKFGTESNGGVTTEEPPLDSQSGMDNTNRTCDFHYECAEDECCLRVHVWEIDGDQTCQPLRKEGERCDNWETPNCPCMEGLQCNTYDRGVYRYRCELNNPS